LEKGVMGSAAKWQLKMAVSYWRAAVKKAEKSFAFNVNQDFSWPD
jgi:hypothetical protein